MRLRALISELMRPIIRRMPRGRRFLCKCYQPGWQYDRIWAKAPRRHRIFFDKTLQAYVYADLGVWSGRGHYFRGEYHDAVNRLLIQEYLTDGDTYIDVGANYGIHTLCACRTVGLNGQVMSFEPNPLVYEMHKALLTINRITNCAAYNLGLSDSNGKLTMYGHENELTDHTGTFSFRSMSGARTKIREVPVSTGDEILKNTRLTGRILVKIDTEGFEHHVIRGLDKLLVDYDDLGLAVEVTDEWLRQTGSSAAELFEHMNSRGFNAYTPVLRWHRIMTQVLHFQPMEGPADQFQYNVLFAREEFLTKRRRASAGDRMTVSPEARRP